MVHTAMMRVAIRLTNAAYCHDAFSMIQDSRIMIMMKKMMKTMGLLS
jgi:hypothetical protein